MKCPKCQAKLLPVDGELFCLQCGAAVHAAKDIDPTGPELEDTTDPVLQKAIIDTVGHSVTFRLPVSGVKPVSATKSFVAMRSVLASPHPALAAVGVPSLPVPVVPALPMPVAQKPEEAPPKESPVPGLTGESQRAGLVSKKPWGLLSPAWLAGIAVFGLFLASNIVIQTAYAGKVFPGVKVGNVPVGGVKFESLSAKLPSGTPPHPTYLVHVGGATYDAGAAELAKTDLDRAVAEAKAIGHSTPLPLAGLIQALMSKPVTLHYVMDTPAVIKFAKDIVDRTTIMPSEPTLMVVGGQALVISEKYGHVLNVDKAAAAISESYGKNTSLNLTPDQQVPLVTAASYLGTLQDAQTTLSLTLQIKIRGKTYQPSNQVIGDWIVFRKAAKGFDINPAGVVAYVATIPGSFDRAGTITAIINALKSKSDLTYVPSTKRTTGNPSLASVAAVNPMATYVYCVRSDRPEDLSSVGVAAAEVLSQTNGWTLRGRVKFAAGTTGCNVTLALIPAQVMARVGAGCAGVSSCHIDGQLFLNADTWSRPPSGWTGSVSSFQQELINHEIGHWLGFDHGSCTRPNSAPVLGSPTLILSGCSPNWYSVPVESQMSKAWSPL